MDDIKEGSKEDVDQQFMNNIEFFRFEFNEKLHMIQDDEKRKLLRAKWFQNKKINPISGRKIKHRSGSYHRLCRLTGLVIKDSDLGMERFEVKIAHSRELSNN
jgi:hypothetical protein